MLISLQLLLFLGGKRNGNVERSISGGDIYVHSCMTNARRDALSLQLSTGNFTAP